MPSTYPHLLTPREIGDEVVVRKAASLQALRTIRQTHRGSPAHAKCLTDLNTLKQHLKEEQPLCMLLHEAIAKCFPGPHGGITFRGSTWGNSFVGNRELTFMNEMYSMQLFVADETSEKLLGRVEKDDNYRMNSIPDNTSSLQTLDTVRQWLANCKTNHQRCHYAGEQALPTRVVDVGYPVRLHEGKGARGKYACLSHCWGKLQIIRTLKENHSDMKAAIPWESLPQTFKDAIDFTRRLGLRYIWIDSLCIIQDDPQDWKQEAAMMGNIYRHSYVTLAASKAVDSRGGLYSSAHGVDSGPHRLSIDNDIDGTPCNLYAKLELRHMHSIDGERAFPLLTRAWVYQERLLSPRVVHFAETEVIWECFEDYLCECGKTQLNNIAKLPSKLLFASHLVAQSKGNEISAWPTGFIRAEAIDSPVDVVALSNPTVTSLLNKSTKFMTAHEQLWRQMVQEYTTLGITYVKDTFPAVAGIAQVWIGLSKDEYLAGLWRSSLLRDMLWQVRLILPRVDPPIAPTWSWASLSIQGSKILHYDSEQSAFFRGYQDTGEATWSRRDEEYRDIAEILEVSCNSTNFIDEAVTGYIKLSTLAIPGVLTWWPRTAQGQGPTRTLFAGGVYLTNNAVAGVQIDTVTQSLDEKWSEDVSIVRITDFMQKDLLPDMACLILKEKTVNPSSEPEYERIGYIRVVPGCIDMLNLVPAHEWGPWETWQELRNNNYAAVQQAKDKIWERAGKPDIYGPWELEYIFDPFREKLHKEFEIRGTRTFKIV
ncbi:hypothetical protein ACN47E_006801 [Coniothyrium glycines]